MGVRVYVEPVMGLPNLRRLTLLSATARVSADFEEPLGLGELRAMIERLSGEIACRDALRRR